MAELRITGACEPLELAAEQERDGKRLRPFSMVAYTGAAMSLEGFYRPVVVDLAGLSVPNQRLPILRQHDPERIVAHTEEVEVTAQRIKVAGVMSGVGEAAQEVLSLASNQFPWQASIGASADSKEFVEAGASVKVNGRNVDGPVVVVRKATLREISFVPLGADHGTSARVAASKGAAMEFNAWLTAKGFEPDKLTDAQRKPLEAAHRLETAPPPPAPAPEPAPKPKPTGLEDVLAAARAEEDRKGRITEIVARVITDQPDMIAVAEALGRQAIEGKWDTDRFELEILRARRPSGGAHLHIPRGEPQVTEEVVECAVAMAGSLTNPGRHYKAETIEAARKKWRNGLSMGEMAVAAAQRQGYRGYSLRANLREVLRAAMTPPDLRAGVAGPSTYSVPNILSNVANKFALEGFYAVDGAWREISSRRSVSDFKQTTSLRATADLQYKKLAPGGEIQHGEIGEKAYTNQAYTYARMIGINREDWINDDTGALAGMSREMGIGAGDAINNVFWTVFLNNSSFFAAGNNNVSTGVPSLTSLAAADSVFRLQTKPNGRPLGLEPAILLVPTALRITAMGLMTDTMVGTTTANTLLPAMNVLSGAYKVVSSPYMSNSAFTGYSAVAWYLLANPSQMSVIEGVFLNGQDTPTVETADFDWNTLGTSMRGYIDFGFAQQEFRAGVRSTGA